MLAPKLHHVASGEFSRTASCPVFTHFGSEAVERPRGSADRALLSASQALSVAMRSANYLPHRFSAFVRHHNALADGIPATREIVRPAHQKRGAPSALRPLGQATKFRRHRACSFPVPTGGNGICALNLA